MGRKGRNRDRRQIDRFVSDSSSNDGSGFGGNGKNTGGLTLGSYSVSGRRNTGSNGHYSQNHDDTHQLRQPFQNRGHGLGPSNHTSIASSFNQGAFVIKPKRFRQQLLQSIDQTIKLIQQWYPDEDSSEDEMDWQPEEEVIVRQPGHGKFYAESAWVTRPNLAKNVPPVEFSIGMKAQASAAAFAAMRRASTGAGFDATSAERMERAMNTDNVSSTLRSCRYVVPTVVMPLDLEAELR